MWVLILPGSESPCLGGLFFLTSRKSFNLALLAFLMGSTELSQFSQELNQLYNGQNQDLISLSSCFISLPSSTGLKMQKKRAFRSWLVEILPPRNALVGVLLLPPRSALVGVLLFEMHCVF